jgi:hypothetical protein
MIGCRRLIIMTFGMLLLTLACCLGDKTTHSPELSMLQIVIYTPQFGIRITGSVEYLVTSCSNKLCPFSVHQEANGSLEIGSFGSPLQTNERSIPEPVNGELVSESRLRFSQHKLRTALQPRAKLSVQQVAKVPLRKDKMMPQNTTGRTYITAL